MKKANIEFTKQEPIIIGFDSNSGFQNYIMIFDLKTTYLLTDEGLVVDGDIKQTIYQMREQQ